MNTLLMNAHLICPVQGFDGIGHVGFTDTHIVASALGAQSPDPSSYDEVIDCRG